MTIKCLNDSIKVWVNDDFVNYGYNATARSGQIALQAEGSEVEFRKVLVTPIKKLTELNKCLMSMRRSNNHFFMHIRPTVTSGAGLYLNQHFTSVLTRKQAQKSLRKLIESFYNCFSVR